MRLRKNRRTERAAVNAARTFFESCNCVFQEVELGNDYGKDAYVDLTEGDRVTGICIAVQIKGGESYRRSDGYVVPLDEAHARIWRSSTVPVAGIVFDPDDAQLRWCNISEFLAAQSGPLPSSIPVKADSILTPSSLESDVKPSFQRFLRERHAGPALLELVAQDDAIQISALLDCFALGRSDARIFIIVRHLLALFTGEPLEVAIRVLAHVTPHPDIFWHRGNWIPENVCEQVMQHLRWSPAEIERMMVETPWRLWYRGGAGQNLYSLLCVDPRIEEKMEAVANSALANNEDEVAFNAVYLRVYWARYQGHSVLSRLLHETPEFLHLPLMSELVLGLKEQGCLTLFE